MFQKAKKPTKAKQPAKAKKPAKGKKPTKGKKPSKTKPAKTPKVCETDCPSMDDIKMEMMESSSEDMCFYNAIGWIDDEGEFQKV